MEFQEKMRKIKNGNFLKIRKKSEKSKMEFFSAEKRRN
jgi:hypothetical protein